MGATSRLLTLSSAGLQEEADADDKLHSHVLVVLRDHRGASSTRHRARGARDYKVANAVPAQCLCELKQR